jgi:hypothetical protein
MRRIGLLCLTLVIALGTLGVGWAHWTDTITVEGTVCTGEVCFSFQPFTYYEGGGCPDFQWCDGWIYDGDTVSCPAGYHFGSIQPVPEGKCVAYVTFRPLDADGNEIDPVTAGSIIKTLEVTIHNAYPHFVADVTFHVCNCGTIPIIIQAPVIDQSPFLLIQYGDNIGTQIHRGECKEISFFVGVVQNEGYWKTPGNDASWTVDDPNHPLLPMDSCVNGPDITFTIEIEAVQWYECED